MSGAPVRHRGLLFLANRAVCGWAVAVSGEMKYWPTCVRNATFASSYRERSERRNGFARKTHNRLHEDGGFVDKAMSNEIQYSINAMLKLGGSLACQLCAWLQCRGFVLLGRQWPRPGLSADQLGIRPDSVSVHVARYGPRSRVGRSG